MPSTTDHGQTAVEQVTLHNVAEHHWDPGANGWRLQRVPEAVRAALNDTAQQKMLLMAGVEVRFVADGPVELVLSRPPGILPDLCEVVQFQGPFQWWLNGDRPSGRVTIGPEPTPLRITPAEGPQRLPAAAREPLAFSPDVTRVVLPPLCGPVWLHEVRPDPGVTVRPPRPDELPDQTVLFYGTSITHGSGTSLGHLTYPSHCAAGLGADAINLGVGGSARCEPELADHFAARDDWDAAVLALSVNMMGCDEPTFAQRVRYMVHTVAGGNVERPVFAVTLWPFYNDVGFNGYREPEPGVVEKAARRRQILRDAVADCPTPNAHLLEGPELFGHFGFLSVDLIHPGELGLAHMGGRLADAIRPHLPAGGGSPG